MIQHFTPRASSYHQNFRATHFGNHCLIRQLANLILTKPRSPPARDCNGQEKAIELLPAPTSCGDNRRMLPIEIRKPVDTFHDSPDFQASFKAPTLERICWRERVVTRSRGREQFVYGRGEPGGRVSRLTRLPRNDKLVNSRSNYALELWFSGKWLTRGVQTWPFDFY